MGKIDIIPTPEGPVPVTDAAREYVEKMEKEQGIERGNLYVDSQGNPIFGQMLGKMIVTECGETLEALNMKNINIPLK